MKKYTLFILIAFVVLQCCTPCQKADHYYERPATKSYLPHYTNGSYFIYQNAGNAADVDTFFVRNYSDSMDFQFVEKKCDGSYFETRTFKFVSSAHGDSITCLIKAGPNGDNCYLSGFYRQQMLASNFTVENGANPIIVSKYNGDTATLLQNYNVLGSNYSNVLKISSNPVYRNSSIPILFCYAADIGIVQFSTIDQSTNQIGNTYLLKSYVIQ